MTLQRGFTLVELLLSIALIGLIMMLAYGGLSSSIRAATSGDEMVERNNRLRAVHGFVRRQIANALPLTMRSAESLQDDLDLVRFEGGRDSIRFVAPMPGYLGHGGPHEQTLMFERGELLFDHQLLQQSDDSELARAIDDRDPVVLLTDLRDVRFSFLQAAEEEDIDPEWVDEWEEPAQTPLMVRVEVEFAEGARMVWPTLEVAPLIDVAATRSSRRGRPFRGAPNNRQSEEEETSRTPLEPTGEQQ